MTVNDWTWPFQYDGCLSWIGQKWMLLHLSSSPSSSSFIYLLHLIRITLSLSILRPVRYIVAPLVQWWREHPLQNTSHIITHHHHHQQLQQFIHRHAVQVFSAKTVRVAFLNQPHGRPNSIYTHEMCPIGKEERRNGVETRSRNLYQKLVKEIYT